MRTGARIALGLLTLLVATAIAAVAYQFGFDAGITSADGTDVVRVVDAWRGGVPGFGFFPFLFLPFAFFGFLLLTRLALGPWGPGHGGPRSGWRGPSPQVDWDDRARAWHRRQHEGASRDDDAGGSTSTDEWPGSRP